MKVKSFAVGAALLAASALGATAAQANDAFVAATGSIWLAGQPSGVSDSGEFGTETTPANSPLAFQLNASTVTITATGLFSVNGGGCYDGPGTGVCYPDQSGFSVSPWSDDYVGPSALVGIFLDGTAPTMGSSNNYVGPLTYVPGPDYTDPTNTAPGAYSPALSQIFYIGSGVGDVFTAPTGATVLYLAEADSVGGAGDNRGGLFVDVTGATAAVPEPGVWAMMLVGLGGVGAAMRMSRRKPGVILA